MELEQIANSRPTKEIYSRSGLGNSAIQRVSINPDWVNWAKKFINALESENKRLRSLIDAHNVRMEAECKRGHVPMCTQVRKEMDPCVLCPRQYRIEDSHE